MSLFNGSLIVRKDKGDRWIVEESFSYGGVTVQKGFRTDLASVPFPFTFFIPKDGTHSPAAVWHDFGYATQTMERKDVDMIFLEFMKDLEVPLWKRQIMYRAVRLAGWMPWRNYKNELSKKQS